MGTTSSVRFLLSLTPIDAPEFEDPLGETLNWAQNISDSGFFTGVFENAGWLTAAHEANRGSRRIIHQTFGIFTDFQGQTCLVGRTLLALSVFERNPKISLLQTVFDW
jgi:hypothetical protein